MSQSLAQEPHQVKCPFRGVGTALITPFESQDGPIDYGALGWLLAQQAEAEVDFLVVLGTTGESPTVSKNEWSAVVQFVIDTVEGRTPVLVGTGSYDTAHAVELTRVAKVLGADGALVVTPYYNKPTQAGLIDYYTRVADVGLPIVMYNIPGRTAVDIELETLDVLANHPNILGLKDATGTDCRVTTDIETLRDRIVYLSGDDKLTLRMMGMGAQGVISVMSNLIPKEVKQLVDSALELEWEDAGRFDRAISGLTEVVLGSVRNPLGIKCAMAEMGWIAPAWRSPMVMPGVETRDQIREAMRAFGLI